MERLGKYQSVLTRKSAIRVFMWVIMFSVFILIGIPILGISILLENDETLNPPDRADVCWGGVGWRLEYIDSEGQRDQLLVYNGEFAGFALAVKRENEPKRLP